jgi:hypothetical protein
MYCEQKNNYSQTWWSIYDLCTHSFFKNIFFHGKTSCADQSKDFFVTKYSEPESRTLNVYNVTKFNQLRSELQNLTDKQKALVTVAYAHKKKYKPLRIEQATAYKTLPNSIQELLRKKYVLWGLGILVFLRQLLQQSMVLKSFESKIKRDHFNPFWARSNDKNNRIGHNTLQVNL